MVGPKFHVANPLGATAASSLPPPHSAFSAPLAPWPSSSSSSSSSGSSTIQSSSIAIQVLIPEEIEIKTSLTTISDMVAEKMTMAASTEDSRRSILIFAYGTLKRGFSNHGLMQDMIAAGDAAYLGVCRTAERQPLVCGPYRVPFLLNLPGSGERVWGELYAVSSRALVRMDELEGTSRGHYERFPVKVEFLQFEGEAGRGEKVIWAEAYYGHRSYAEALWKRNGEKGYSCYSEKEAKGYVRRKDRPHHLTFLQQIQVFLAE